MATATAQKVTLESVSKKMNNSGDSTRKLDISVDVNEKNGVLQSFTNGNVNSIPESGLNVRGNFSHAGDNLTINLYDLEQDKAKESVNAILDFMDAAKESIKA